MGLTLSLKHMLGLEYWELHEAAFILTTAPKNLVYIGLPPYIYEQLNRRVLYIPENRLNKKAISAQTRKVLVALKIAVENGEIEGLPRNLYLRKSYGRNVSYFVKSQDVIVWALLNNILLPDEMQKLLRIYQLTTKPRKNSDGRVINQIIMQYILIDKPVVHMRDICLNHEWINRFGTGASSQDENRRALQRAMKELLDNYGKYIHQALPEVMQKNEGISRYNFRLLKIAMQTATKVFIEKIGPTNYLAHTEDSFQKAFLNDSVVQLYLENASLPVIQFIKDFCLQTLQNRYTHHKLNCIPKEARKLFTIGELLELNKDLVMKPMANDITNLKIKGIFMCFFFSKKFPKDTRMDSCTMVLLRHNTKQSCEERLLIKYIGEKNDNRIQPT